MFFQICHLIIFAWCPTKLSSHLPKWHHSALAEFRSVLYHYLKYMLRVIYRLYTLALNQDGTRTKVISKWNEKSVKIRYTSKLPGKRDKR